MPRINLELQRVSVYDSEEVSIIETLEDITNAINSLIDTVNGIQEYLATLNNSGGENIE
jgi:hypothetical protein